MTNNSTVKWIAIIVSILITVAMTSFGYVTKRMDKMESRVVELSNEYSIISNELKHINRKIDEIKRIVERENLPDP